MSNPPKVVTDVVDERDEYRCVRCGVSLTVVAGSRHHRQRRRNGGHTVPNLILLCGSGTTGCHGWVHGHPEKATSEGFIIPANRSPMIDPAVIPILQGFTGFWLTIDVTKAAPFPKRIIPAIAAEILGTFNMLPKVPS